MRALAQRRATVEHMARIGNHLGATLGVVTAADFFATLGLVDHIGAVKRVVQGAPARVGGVERVTRVQDRHHQLRAGLPGQLGVHVRGGDAGLFGRLDQVTNAFQEGTVVRHVRGLGRITCGDGAGVGLVPVVELGLQAVTLGQQGDVLGRQVGHDGAKAFPEFGGCHAGAGQHLGFNELAQVGRDLQAVLGDAFSHGGEAQS
ncbi:MAG: hypothetical protein ACD_23C01097G0001 [uncultured bacterium]|nr:MAG: hypothetical protein ACD_23C01097G0001 [uncultured bacterium]